MQIKEANINDLEFLLELKNDPQVRVASFNSDKVAKDTHKAWFLSTLKNRNVLQLIAFESNSKIAQIRFDILENNCAQIDISVNKNYRRRGNGIKVLKAGCNYFFSRFPFFLLLAYVKVENKPSNLLFSKIGFKKKEILNIKGNKAYKYILKRDYYNENKAW